MRFNRSAVQLDVIPEKSVCFCFSDQNILLKEDSAGVSFPLLTMPAPREFNLSEAYWIGFLDDFPCCIISTHAGENTPSGFRWVLLKDYYLNAESSLADVAGYAKLIFDWRNNFRFCGRCGQPTMILPHEQARQCERCGLINYPRISPAVITAVVRDDQILLARGRNFSDKAMFSVLAGFVESGESLEDTVKREIREEVGIEVRNIQYFKSHPWPFPDSLMIGFTAEYASGEIKIDENEIAEAGWYKADALPNVPNRRSISSELIRWFVSARKSGRDIKDLIA